MSAAPGEDRSVVECLGAALAYAARGWHVFPVKPGTKAPATEHGFKDATMDPQRITEMWRRWPDAGVAIATGCVSGLVVLDIDPRHGGEESLETLRQRYDELPNTPKSLTGGGGFHFLFAHPGVIVRNAAKLGGLPGIDLRGDGGYMVAPPSGHASGRTYAWEVDLDPGDVALAPMPSWLLELAAKRKTYSNGRGNRAAGQAGATLNEGERHPALASLAGAMRRKGATEGGILAALSLSNAELCRPPLPDEEVQQIARSYGAYSADPKDNTDAGRFFTEGGSLIVPRLGDEVRALGHVQPGIDGLLYRYNAGVYRRDGDTFARASCRKLLGDRFKRRHVDEALAYVRADYPTVTDRQPEGLLNVENGLLDWRTAPPELRAHSHEILSTVRIPHRWNPAAQCPRILEFLAEVLPTDAPDFVLEVIGYALLPANPLRAAVLLLGPGGNGKSVLLAIIRAFCGPENVSAVSLQALGENRFASAELYGRLANICGDLDARAVRQTDVFKMMTGGDPLYAERKHRDAFTFVSYALPIFSANEPPLSSDQTEGWFDRWLVVPMERRICEAQLDPHLAAKLTTPDELEGLLVVAVEALARLMRRGRFHLPGSVRGARLAYRERLDTVAGFVAEECAFSAHAWTPRKTLYRAYRQWAQGSGRLPVSVATFNDHLRGGFEGRIEMRVRHGIRGWAGLEIVVGGNTEGGADGA